MTIEQLRQAQNEWWNHLLKHVMRPRGFDMTTPKFEVTVSDATWAGKGSVHACTYNLAYALTAKNFEETIAHEVCHVFAARMNIAMGNKNFAWHDSLWIYCYSVVCGFSRGKYHTYQKLPTVYVKKLRQLYVMTAAVAAYKERKEDTEV